MIKDKARINGELEQKETRHRPYFKHYIDYEDSELLTQNEKSLFNAIKRYVDFRLDNAGITATAFPSQETLSKRTGMSVSTVKRAMKGLRDKGIVTVKRQGLNKPNLYTIHDYACMWKCETVEELKELMKHPERLDKLDAEMYLEATDHIGALERQGIISKEEAAKLRAVAKEQEQEHGEEPKEVEEPQAKEKPATGAQPETSITAQPTDISFSNNDYKKNYAPSQDEIYSMDMIKHKFEYEYMLMDRPHEQGIIDSVFDYIYDTLNEPGEFIRVQRSMKPKRVVVSRFMKLTRESILFVIDRYQAQIKRIKYPKQYIITQLYEAPAQFEMDITNRVMSDLYGA